MLFANCQKRLFSNWKYRNKIMLVSKIVKYSKPESGKLFLANTTELKARKRQRAAKLLHVRCVETIRGAPIPLSSLTLRSAVPKKCQIPVTTLHISENHSQNRTNSDTEGADDLVSHQQANPFKNKAIHAYILIWLNCSGNFHSHSEIPLTTHADSLVVRTRILNTFSGF